MLENLNDNFHYNEQIFALYFSAEKKFKRGLTTQIGIRYEYTNNERKSVALNNTTKNSFHNLFPSIFVSYDLNDDNSLSFAYSKRIERPSFSQLNPFRTYSNLNSYESGNPNLIPSISHNFEVSYTYNDLYFTIYDSYLNKAKDFLTIINNNSNEIITKPENYFNQNTFGIESGFNFNHFKWLNSYNSANFYYNYSKSYLKDITNQEEKGAGFYFSTKNSITIFKPKDLYLLVNFFQDFPTTEGFIKSYNRASLDIGFRIKLLNKKLTINGSFTDIFKQHRNNTIEKYPNYLYNSRIYNDIQKINITLTYLFGKQNKTVKKINVEEKERL